MERARHRSLPLTRLPSPSIAMQSRPDRRCASVLSAPAPYAVRPEPPTKTGGNTIVVFLNKTSSDPTRANEYDSDRPRSSRFHCCHHRRHRRRVLGRAPTDRGRTDGRTRAEAGRPGRTEVRPRSRSRRTTAPGAATVPLKRRSSSCNSWGGGEEEEGGRGVGNVPLPLHRDLAGSTNVIPQLEAGPASCMGMGWAHPLDLIM